MTDTFAEVRKRLREASTYKDVFGARSSSDMHRQFRSYATIVHPDHNPGRQGEATELFTILQRLYQEAIKQHTALIIETRSSRYVCDTPPIQGDIADLYPSSSGTRQVLVKIARSGRSDDLMQAERHALATIDGALGGQAVRAHFPTLIDHATVRDAAGGQRSVHVLADERGTFSVADVLRAYPGGLDTADAAWMFNRMLAALGLAHSQGIIHGAVLPTHMLIQPEEHNGVLIDWCYSVPTGDPIRAVSPSYRDDYPTEVLAKQRATPATDIYMAARCMVRLLGGAGDTGSLPERVPAPVRALLAGCLIPASARRAGDAWELLDDFRDVLAELYGPPRFRPFVMPSTIR